MATLVGGGALFLERHWLGFVDGRLAGLELLPLLGQRLRFVQLPPEVVRAPIRGRFGPAPKRPVCHPRGTDCTRDPGSAASHEGDATLPQTSCLAVAPYRPEAAPAGEADSDRGKE